MKNIGLQNAFRLSTICCYTVILLILILTASTGSCQNSIRTNAIKVGVGMVEITPPIGYPHYRGELAGIITHGTGIKNPLYARSLVFRQGDMQGALLICDLNAVPRDLIRLVRERASKQTGIPFQYISVAATHTHTAPSIREAVPTYADRDAAGKLTGEDQQGYIGHLIKGMTQAIVTANKQAQEVELISGIGQAAGISFNRRYLMTDGRVRFNPGVQNPKIVRPVGPVDPDVHFVMFRPVAHTAFHASLTVFANHTDTEGGTDFSADYPFFLHKYLGETFGKQMVSVFGAGPCGDINHIDVSQPKEAVEKKTITERIGKKLAEAVRAAVTNVQQQSANFRVASKTFYLPLQNFTATELQWASKDTNKLYPERDFLDNVRRRKILSLEQLRKREAIPPSVSGEPWLLPLEIQGWFQCSIATLLSNLMFYWKLFFCFKK